jgi:hypothetical protein
MAGNYKIPQNKGSVILEESLLTILNDIDVQLNAVVPINPKTYYVHVLNIRQDSSEINFSIFNQSSTQLAYADIETYLTNNLLTDDRHSIVAHGYLSASGKECVSVFCESGVLTYVQYDGSLETLSSPTVVDTVISIS